MTGLATDPVAHELAALLGRPATLVDDAAAQLVRGMFVGRLEEAAESGEVRRMLGELAKLIDSAEESQPARTRAPSRITGRVWGAL